MSSPPTESTGTSLFALPAQALRAEREKLQTARNEIVLFGGSLVGSVAGFSYYRFEVPEDLYLRPVHHVSCSFNQLQPVTIGGRIVSVENQFVVVALPMDFGQVLPEIKCTWDYDDHLPHVIDVLAGADPAHPVASAVLHPERPENSYAVTIEPAATEGTSPEHADAVKKILRNRISYLWGPVRSGKTQTLALVALSYLRAGKSVLLTAPGAAQADQLLLRTLALGKELGIDLNAIASRVGLPADPGATEIGSFSLEREVETKRSDKKKPLEERVAL